MRMTLPTLSKSCAMSRDKRMDLSKFNKFKWIKALVSKSWAIRINSTTSSQWAKISKWSAKEPLRITNSKNWTKKRRRISTSSKTSPSSSSWDFSLVKTSSNKRSRLSSKTTTRSSSYSMIRRRQTSKIQNAMMTSRELCSTSIRFSENMPCLEWSSTQRFPSSTAWCKTETTRWFASSRFLLSIEMKTTSLKIWEFSTRSDVTTKSPNSSKKTNKTRTMTLTPLSTSKTTPCSNSSSNKSTCKDSRKSLRIRCRCNRFKIISNWTTSLMSPRQCQDREEDRSIRQPSLNSRIKLEDHLKTSHKLQHLASLSSQQLTRTKDKGVPMSRCRRTTAPLQRRTSSRNPLRPQLPLRTKTCRFFLK